MAAVLGGESASIASNSVWISEGNGGKGFPFLIKAARRPLANLLTYFGFRLLWWHRSFGTHSLSITSIPMSSAGTTHLCVHCVSIRLSIESAHGTHFG